VADRARVTRALAGALVLFLLLEALTRAGLVNEAYLPPASSVLVMTGRLLADTEFLVQVAGTLQAWAVGLLVAIAIAIPLGVVMG